MQQNQIKDLGGEEFRRLTGIKPETFKKILKILSDADRKKKARGGRRNELNLKDQLLVTLTSTMDKRSGSREFCRFTFGKRIGGKSSYYVD